MEQDVTILVCCHKKDFCYEGTGYLPVQVGKAISSVDLGFQGDDEGENISEKNRHFCELTAHYWYWKNRTPSRYVGLNHYRRYFDFSGWNRWGVSFRKVSEAWMKDNPPVLPDLDPLFQKYDIVLAKRRPHPVNLWYDYAMSHIVNDELILKQVIDELTPDYSDAFEEVMRLNNKLSHYNMFIMPAERFTEYSAWLFKILFEVEKRVKISPYADQARVFGYLSERMINIFAYRHRLRVKYLPVLKVTDGPEISAAEERWSAVRDNFTSWFFTFPRRMRGRLQKKG
jgi:hypothetical protein